VNLYSAFIVVPHTQGAQVRITQCYLQITPYLPLPRKRSPDGASLDWGCGHLTAAYYSFIYPRKNERLIRPGWLTYSGRFTHICGHPSAAGRAQDSESSPARDRRSTTVPRNEKVVPETSCGVDHHISVREYFDRCLFVSRSQQNLVSTTVLQPLEVHTWNSTDVLLRAKCTSSSKMDVVRARTHWIPRTSRLVWSHRWWLYL